MADAVYFITGENEYIGTTGYQEICYARKLNKPITYFSNKKLMNMAIKLFNTI